MKCPYCAEIIKDEALLCRFCGARKANSTSGSDQWLSPQAEVLAQAPEKQQRDFIISSSAWLLFLGGIFELPVTNDSHESIFLHFYHLAFAVLMIVSGLGLLRRKYWGYQAIQMATFVFSIDRIFFLFTANTQAELTDAGIPSVIGDMAVDLFDPRALEMIGHAFTLLGLLSWWGFSLYLYYRRHHFE